MNQEQTISVNEALWFAAKGPWISLPEWLRNAYDNGRIVFENDAVNITLADYGFGFTVRYRKTRDQILSPNDLWDMDKSVKEYETVYSDGRTTRVKKVLDYGIVSLVDWMGSDAAIARAARTSFGHGQTQKTVEDDRRLIRRLVRDRHTSPVEMGEAVFYLRLPIFVMRQLVRHRTSSLNEFSARYKEMQDLFHVPDEWRKQSGANKQGSAGIYTAQQNTDMSKDLVTVQKASMDCYRKYLEAGVAREQAREVLPVGIYTELYWKQDIHNLLHMLKLRLDPHAQLEIRVYAQAMYNFVKPLFPETCQAFEDYILNSRNISALDMKLMRDLIKAMEPGENNKVQGAAHYGMSESEYSDFIKWWVALNQS